MRQAIDVPQPALRAVLVTVAGIVLVFFGQREMLAKSRLSFLATNAQRNFNQCRQLVDKMKADPENLVAFWKKEPQQEIPIGEDDPVRTHSGGDAEALVIVAFSDLECPSCKRFAQLVETKIQPLFDGHLSVVFKHHPLDKNCNERISSTVHPHSCAAARMAEAARALGGNEAFWAAHDYLFEHQADLEKGLMTAQKLAAAIKLDPGALQSAMESEAVTGRIQADIELAKKVNVAATPAVYVAGRLVDTIPRNEIGFWDKLADMYWERIGIERPEKTKLSPVAATPGSPDRKAVP
jgi:protein-disulfide isomerase